MSHMLLSLSSNRTLTKAQWKIIGTGPYRTLSEEDRQTIVDTTCERYGTITDDYSRYEFVR